MRKHLIPLLPFRNRVSSGQTTFAWEKWCHRIIKFGNLFIVLPFEFDSNTDRFRKLNSSFKWYFWCFVFFMFTLDNISLVMNSKVVDIRDVGYQEYVDFYVHYFSRFSGLLVGSVLAMHLTGFTDEINFFQANYRTWQNNHLEFGADFSGPRAKSLGRFMKFAAFYFIVEPFMGVTVYLESRNSRRFWFAQFLLGNYYDTSFGVAVACVMDFYFSACLTALGGGAACLLSMHGPILEFWITTLEKKFKERPQSWQNAYMTYRSIQVVIKAFYPTICKSLQPTLIYVGFWSLVACTCGMITRFTTFPPHVLLDFALCSLLVFLLMKKIMDPKGKVFEKGIDFKTLLKKGLVHNRFRIQRRIMLRQIASLEDLKMFTGSQFFLRKSTFLVYARLVVDRTIDGILTAFDKSHSI